MNTAQKVAKESTITFTGLVYGNVNRFLYTALLARWVGVEYLGVYSLANSIILIAEVLAKMGLEVGVMRFVSRLDPKLDKDKMRKVICASLKATTTFSLLIMVILILSSGWLAKDVFKESQLLQFVIIAFSITLPFNALTNVSAFATQGLKFMKYKVLTTQFIKPTILFGIMALSYWFLSKKMTIMLPFAVTGITGCVLMLIMLKKLTGIRIGNVLSAQFDKELLKFSYPLMFVTVLQTLMHWMDILMLGYFTDSTIVGLYHPAVRTAGLLQALLLSLASIYSPLLSQMHSKGETEKMSDLYKLVSRWLFTFAFPFALVLLLLPTKVMLVFGPAYISSALVLVILTAATFSQSILGAAGPILSMSGYIHLSLWNSLGAFLLNVVLNILLIPRFGIYGAAWATLISLVASGLARVIEVRIILKLSFWNKGFLKPLLAGIISASALWILKPYIMPFHTLITLMLAGLISLSFFVSVLWLLKFEPDDRDFLKGLGILIKAIKR